jgi:hypothetical protein
MRILFISSNCIGDAVITCGVLDHLIRIYRDSRITIACGLVAEGVFARMTEELAHVFEPTAQSIRNWVTQWERNAGRGNGGLTTAEREEFSDSGVVPRHPEFPGSALQINNFQIGGVQLQPYSV